MEIYQLKGLDYYINEKEAFDKSVFNAAEYSVTLAVPEGTNLSAYINEGDQIAGNYTVNGLTTDFESLVQDISINRQFQSGYDMYNLKLSENILNVARASILDVQDGGTGSGELNGILKGNGLSPVSTAIDGDDYWSPATLQVDNTEVPWTQLATNNTDGATGWVYYAVKNGNVYINAAGNWGTFANTGTSKQVSTMPEPAYRPSGRSIQSSMSTSGGNRQMAWEVRPDGTIWVVCSDTSAGNKYGAFLASYPIGL